MEQLQELLVQYWPQIVSAALALFALIARQTETKSDDEVHGFLSKIWQQFQKGVDKVTLNKGPKSIHKTK